jgi:hypothetical protein
MFPNGVPSASVMSAAEVVGLLKLGWLVALNASARNFRLTLSL